MNRYAGKRFAGFLFATIALTGALIFGPEGSFSAYATTIGLLYGAYLGGQSFTDSKGT